MNNNTFKRNIVLSFVLTITYVLLFGCVATKNVKVVQSVEMTESREMTFDDYGLTEEDIIEINQSELYQIRKIKEEILVTGHKSPDSDTVCSSIVYADLLNKLGIKARPVVLGKINKESEYILSVAEAATPEKLDDATGKYIALVDHSQYIQSSDNLDKATIVSVIDHHGVGSIVTGNQLVYDARPLGSTATILWIKYRDYGVKYDSTIATLMLGGIYSDTKGLTSDTTTEADRKIAAILLKESKVKNEKEFYDSMYKETISHEGMTDEEIYYSDYKEYVTKGIKYSVANVSVYDDKEAFDIAHKLKQMIRNEVEKRGQDFGFILISIVHDTESKTYFVGSDEKADEIMEKAFGDEITRDEDGDMFLHDTYASRKKIFIPNIDKVLEGK